MVVFHLFGHGLNIAIHLFAFTAFAIVLRIGDT